jgi:lysophospholipase L1-like esterase
MKRVWIWFAPATIAIVSAAVFAQGFYLGVSGSAGVLIGPSAEPTGYEEEIRPLSVVLLGDSLARGVGDQSGLGIGGNLDILLSERDPAHRPAANLAVSGSRTPELLRLLERDSLRAIVSRADLVVISIGGNDLFGAAGGRGGEAPPETPDEAIEEVADRVERAVRIVRESAPEARVFLVGLYNPFAGTEFGDVIAPGVSVWNAAMLERFRDDPNVTVVQTYDLFSHRDRLSADRFHPGETAYAIIARRIVDSL